jgi:hypothetical protein
LDENGLFYLSKALLIEQYTEMVEEKIKIKKKTKKTDVIKNDNKMDVEESIKDKKTSENNTDEMKVEEPVKEEKSNEKKEADE